VLLSSHEAAEAASSQYGFNEKQIDFLRDSCKRIKKHWVPPEGFPNERVVDAYLKPTVDRSKEDFEWGKPDMDLLRLFCREKFGWEADRAERTLQDVLKHWEEHKRQRLMTEYVQASYQQRFAKVGSKRLKRAVQHLSGADAANDGGRGKQRRRGKQQGLSKPSGGRGSSRPARSADQSQHGKRTLGEADDGRNAAAGESGKEPDALTPVLGVEPDRKRQQQRDQPQSTRGRTAVLDDDDADDGDG
jgi:DNA excision repair protein ERCC-5